MPLVARHCIKMRENRPIDSENEEDKKRATVADNETDDQIYLWKSCYDNRRLILFPILDIDIAHFQCICSSLCTHHSMYDVCACAHCVRCLQCGV